MSRFHAAAPWRSQALASARTTALLALALLAGCSKPEAAPTSGTSTSANDATGSASSAGAAVDSLAPNLTLTLHDGKTVRLRDKKGTQLLLYFYPKDGTPG